MISGKRGGKGEESGGRRDSGKDPRGCSFLPDLSLWYDWHAGRETLPEGLNGKSLSAAAEALGVRGWIPYAPWRAEFPGLDVSRGKSETEIVRDVRTSKGVLTSRWILGPDGDWWQNEYPVKTADDLEAAYKYCRAKSYHIARETSFSAAGADPENDILAVKLPQQPFSEIIHDLLGFGEGIIILMQEEERIAELTGMLADSYAALLDSLIGHLSGDPAGEGPGAESGDYREIVFYSPDNLDANFISPNIFDRYLLDGYAKTVDRLHRAEYGLAVHLGGYVKPLLSRLGDIGIDILQGISGPPQSDASLREARELTGAEPLLWGGIPQDFVLPEGNEKNLEECAQIVADACSGDRRIVAGVSDKVPVEADLEKLKYLRDFF